MYERYIEEARRAIFYARAVTMFTGATAIDSIHMLSGVMWQADFRAQILFGLHEIFPLYSGRPYLFVESEILKKVDGPQLTNDSKRILARTAMEAEAMGDYWIGTEHLLLGILAEQNCTAERYLAKAGITLKSARRVVKENKSSRPDYSPVPSSPVVKNPSPLDWMILRWRKWREKARG